MPIHRIPRFLTLFLAALALTACPESPAPPPATELRAVGATTEPEPEAVPEALRYGEEVIVLVEVNGNTFRPRPKRAVLYHPSQKITWIARDRDMEIEIVWKDTTPPPPPAVSCLTGRRECGNVSINRPAGTREAHRYAIRGSKGGKPLDPLDPEVIIFY